MAGATLGPKAISQMREIARRVLGEFRNNEPTRQRWGTPPNIRRDAVIVGALAAPSSSADTPTSCTIAFLDLNDEGKLVDSGKRETAYNYDESLSAVDGTLTAVEFRHGRWRFYWASCAASPDFEDLSTTGTE